MADVNEEMATCNMEAINKEAGCEKVLFQKCDASKRSDLERKIIGLPLLISLIPINFLYPNRGIRMH